MSTSETKLDRRLPLVRHNRRLLAHAQREMAMVDSALVDTFRRLAEGLAPWPLLLYGPVGSGKTCAALSLCDVARTACYWTVDRLCSSIMQSDPEDVRDIWNAIETKDLAVLDELGTRDRISDLHYSAVKDFADARELNAGRRAIYISNASPKKLASLYDDRIISRILCGTKLELGGRDLRIAR